jgi:hypothetical protein
VRPRLATLEVMLPAMLSDVIKIDVGSMQSDTPEQHVH